MYLPRQCQKTEVYVGEAARISHRHALSVARKMAKKCYHFTQETRSRQDL